MPDSPTPNRPHSVEPQSGGTLKSRNLARDLVVLLLAVAAIFIFYRSVVDLPGMREREVEKWNDRLTATADLMDAAIERWVAELKVDADVVAAFPSVRAVASGNQGDAHLGDILEDMRRRHGYLAVRLVRSDGNPIDGKMPDTLIDHALGIVTSETTVDVVIVESRATVVVAAPVQATSVFVVILVDPSEWLNPILRHDPFHAESAESFLARRRGDAVQAISPLRLTDEFPLERGHSAGESGGAALAAVSGVEIVADYIDYRDEETLAATRRIEGTDWGLVVKVDRDEVLAEFDQRLRSKLLASAGSLLALLILTAVVVRSERARARRRLDRVRDRYQAVLDQAADAILFISFDDGHILSANAAAEVLYGRSAAELVTMTIADLRAPDAKPLTRPEMEGARKRGQHIYETTHLAADGEAIPVEVNSRYLEIDGEAMFLSVVRDITERRRSEAKLRAFVEATPIGAINGHVDGRVLDANDEFLRIIGRSREDLEAGLVRWDDFTPPEWTDIDEKGVAETLEHRACTPYRKEYVRPDGSRVQVIVGCSILPESDGESIAFIVDLTGQVQAEEELRLMNVELEERVAERTAALEAATDEIRRTMAEVQDLYDNAPVAYHSLDAEGRYVRVNDTELRWLGYTRDEMIGHPASDFATVDPDVLKQNIRKTMENQPFHTEIEMRRKDGTLLPVLVTSVPQLDASGDFVMTRSSMIDDTARRRLLRELSARNAALVAANRELEAFSYSVSHDLRAPLRAIDGFARILAEDYGTILDDEARRIIGVIRGGATRMGMLIDDLLSLSRAGRVELAVRPCDMIALVRRAIEGEAETSGVEVSVAELPGAPCDNNLMLQVWTNLVSNAFKFTRGREGRRVEISAESNDQEIIYRVRDNGAGFDPRYADKLFQVFQRLHSDRDFEGTGIGLAIVRRIVERHGGRVGASSVQGEGSEFWFSLPR